MICVEKFGMVRRSGQHAGWPGCGSFPTVLPSRRGAIECLLTVGGSNPLTSGNEFTVCPAIQPGYPANLEIYAQLTHSGAQGWLIGAE